ncbi:MAG TPA: MoaD/ThiS family protein [Nitrososphaeraceae archaeon]|nr:MoaD/ThiS family protein [Nitrososphaeraceae archaeon]
MITINLLGGAKKIIGASSLVFYRSTASISEILAFLQENALETKILDSNNLLIAVNGIESSALSGNDTVAKTGDIITIVSVVHGGM